MESREPQRVEPNAAKGPKPFNHRIPEQEWIYQHQAEYRGAWVALEGPHLIAIGSSAIEVLEAAKKLGYDQPLIHHIPKEPELPWGGW